MQMTERKEKKARIYKTDYKKYPKKYVYETLRILNRRSYEYKRDLLQNNKFNCTS